MSVFLVLCLAALACSGDGSTLGPDGKPPVDTQSPEGQTGSSDDRTVTLDQVSSEIFAPRCAISGCHSGPTPSRGLSLVVDRIETEVIGVNSQERPELRLIEPGNADASYLFRKIRGEDINGVQMPPGGVLTENQIALVRAWIEAIPIQ